MKREWKCGDVAIATVRGAQDVRVMRVDFSTAMGQRYYGWASYAPIDRTNLHEDAEVTDARPLVVIDPEDREQVERLRDLYLARDVERYGLTIDGKAREAFVDDITAALREFANLTPPKPDEPTGLGAVVETPGGRYVRSDVETCNPWRGPKGIPFEWDDLDGPVRVLSEGVAS